MSIKLKLKPQVASSFKFIDLFCGIGGFHSALRQLDGKCVFACDIDSKCRDIYALNYGMMPYGDITQIDFNTIPPHDILTGGFPCQSFSSAGNKRGMTDPRGNLFNYIIQILTVCRPKIAILENVKHIKSISGGTVYRYIYDLLNKSGYNVFDVELSPDNIGVPQNRPRIIFIVIRSDIWTQQIEDDIKHELDLNIIKYKSRTINVLETLPVDIKYKISLELKNAFIMWDELLSITQDLISPIIPAYFKLTPSITNTDNKNSYILKNNKFYNRNKQVLDIWCEKHQVQLSLRYNKLEWTTGQLNANDSIFNYYIQLRPSGVRVKSTHRFPALVAMVQIPILGKEQRYLTPRECANLQSFPQTMNFGSQSDGVTYKQLGNSVNVDVIKIVAESYATFFQLMFSSALLHC